MRDNHWLECIKCGQTYDVNKIRYTCDCGALLEVKRDLSLLKKIDLPLLWEERLKLKRGILHSGVWRYKELIFDIEDKYIISRQEGNTRLYESGLAGKYAGLEKLLLKHEGENPTGSFKDRGMTCGITAANFLGAKNVACASTGNTSASMASYAASSGMDSFIFIPSGKIAYGKLAQALAYGGKTLQIEGNFDDAMRLVQEVCAELNIYLLNSINPFRIEGQKAIVFEILQQLDWNVPDWFIIPGGNLGNNTALSKGIMELYELGIINKIPRMAVIQAHGANPLCKMWKNKTQFIPTENPETIATAIKIGNPVSWEKSLHGIEWMNGVVDDVTEQEIMDAKAMVDLAGIGAEPASCCVVAGVKKLVENGIINKNASAVGVLTGNLLKDPDAVVNYHLGKLDSYGVDGKFKNKPISIKATLDDVKKVIAKRYS